MSTQNYHKKGALPQLNQADLEVVAFGRVAPQSIELEDAILGALLIDRSAFDNVSEVLSSDAFYKRENRLVYSAIKALADKGDPVDILTVAERLTKLGSLDEIGGAYYLVELTQRVASAANIEYHARIVAQKYLRRQMADVSMLGAKLGYDETRDIFEDLATFEKAVFDISKGAFKKAASNISDISANVLRLAEKAIESKGLTGIPGKLSVVVKQTGGWQPSDLIIVAARPGMGKTAFVVGEGFEAARNGYPVQMFSLEMSADQLGQRILAAEANLNVQSIRNGRLTERDLLDLAEAAERIQGIPFYVDDTPGIGLSELRAKARKAVLSNGVRLVIVDYLQLMEGTGENREQQISTISRGLKALAKELNVPIIALSQLSRAVETRGGSKRPLLSDLRESGAIEQDADSVVFIYRPEYYGILEDEQGASTRGTAEIIFAKHRNGAVGTCDPVGFSAYKTEFHDLDTPQIAPRPEPNIEAQTAQTVIESSRPNADEDIPF